MELSIIIPVYNVEKYIRRCLDSIYNQNIPYESFEVIIVNDGTPDKSMEVVHEYLNLHKNMKIINQENQGLSIARNNGLAATEGKYVWFIDSDDWICEDSIKSLFGYLNKQYNLIATNLYYTYDNPVNNRFEREINKDLLLSSTDYISNYSVGASQRFIIKRDLLVRFQLKFYPGILHEDAEFNLKLVYYAKQVYLLKSSLYFYYQGNANSIMASWKLKNSEDMYKVYRLLTVFWKEKVVNDLKLTCRIYSFKVLLTSLDLKNDLEFKLFYTKIKKEIKKEALYLLFSKNVTLKRRFIFFTCSISPYYFNIIRQKIEKVRA